MLVHISLALSVLLMLLLSTYLVGSGRNYLQAHVLPVVFYMAKIESTTRVDSPHAHHHIRDFSHI
jgi:hypothetical protein